MHKIVLSSGKEFMCSPTQTILEGARASGVAIAHSCRSGRCGVCLAPVLEGQTSVIIAEQCPLVSDRSPECVLTCCRAPLTDVRLDVDDLGEIGALETLTLPCRIDSIDLLNDDVLGIVLRLPPSSNLLFMPGQYLDLIVGHTRRSYSIANSPREDGKIELHVGRVEQGVMSNILFNQSKENDLLRLEGPLGTFSYRDQGEENVILMATGTGIAPIKSLLESFSSGTQSKKIFVFWGMRYKKDFYFNMESLEGSFSFVPVLSREDLQGSFCGYVQQAVLSHGINLARSSVYACGSEFMIKDARAVLLANGLPDKRFHSDAFVRSD